MKLKRIVALLATALVLSTGAQAETYQWDAVKMGGGGFVSGIVASKSERGIIYARTDVGGAYRWDAGRARWISLMDWVSDTENGLLGIESLAIDPNNAANVYLLAGTSYSNNGKTKLLRSSDYGNTFTATDVTAQFKAHGNGMGRQSGEKLQVDPGSPNVLYAGTRRDGLFKSTDTGATWNRVASLPVTATPNDNGISLVLLDPASVDNGVVTRLFVGVSRFASSGPNLYFSYDGGETFEAVEGGPAGMIPQRAAMSAEGKLFIAYANGTGPHGTTEEPMDRGQLWEYDFYAGQWTNITPAGMARPFGGISVDAANPNRLVASTINTWMPQHNGAYGDRILTSTDAGRSWSDVVARGMTVDTMGIDWIRNNSIHWAGSIEFDPFDSKSVLVTSGNGLFKTADIDAPKTTWRFDVAGLEETVPLNAVSVLNGPLISTIGDYDGFMHGDVTQYGPIHTPQMGTTTGLAVAAQDPRFIARAGNALYYSANGGASWNQSAVMNGVKGQLALSADGHALLHSPENATVSYRSTNFGASWTAIAGLAVRNARPVADTVNPAKFYVYDGASGRMLVSTDGGASFTAKGTLAAGGASLIRTAPGIEGDVWACAGGLTHSTDSGASFQKLSTVASCSAVGFGKAAPGADYPALYIWGTVGTVRGILRSVDKGASWVRVNDDDHEYGGPGNGQFVMGDMNLYGRVYMSTVGLGMVYGDSLPTGGAVPVVPVAPGGPVTAPVNKCEYLITASWNGGYNAAVRITNNRPAVMNGWTVNWTYTDGSAVQGYWNAAVAGNAPTYTATPNQSWNHDIYPGSTVEFGMTVGGGSAIPQLSGEACQ